jgi:hypothetical protein
MQTQLHIASSLDCPSRRHPASSLVESAGIMRSSISVVYIRHTQPVNGCSIDYSLDPLPLDAMPTFLMLELVLCVNFERDYLPMLNGS